MANRTTMTLNQLDAMFVERLGNSAFWTQPERLVYLNDALRMWNCLTGYWSRTVTLVTVPLLPYYDLPNTLTASARVTFQGKQLDPDSIASWDADNPEWEAESSDPARWAPVGIALIAVRPTDAVGNRQLVISGVSATPVLANSGDYVNLGTSELNAVLDYAQHVASFKEGGQEFASTGRLLKGFFAQAAEKNSKLRTLAPWRKWTGTDKDQGYLARRRGTEGSQWGARS